MLDLEQLLFASAFYASTQQCRQKALVCGMSVRPFVHPDRSCYHNISRVVQQSGCILQGIFT